MYKKQHKVIKRHLTKWKKATYKTKQNKTPKH